MAYRYTTTGNAQSWRSQGYQDRMKVPGPLIGFEQAKTIGNRFVAIAVALGLVLVVVLAFEGGHAVWAKRPVCGEQCK